MAKNVKDLSKAIGGRGSGKIASIVFSDGMEYLADGFLPVGSEKRDEFLSLLWVLSGWLFKNTDRFDCIDRILSYLEFPALTDDEADQLLSGKMRGLKKAMNTLKSRAKSKNEMLSMMTLIFILMAIGASVTFLGLFTSAGSSIVGTVYRGLSGSGGQAQTQQIQPTFEALRPTTVPPNLPTPTSLPKPIPTSAPFGQFGGSYGTASMPEDVRQKLAPSVKELAVFLFGGQSASIGNIEGAIPVLLKFAPIKVPGDEAKGNFQKAIRWYVCQCTLENVDGTKTKPPVMSAKCREETGLANGVGYYEYLAKLTYTYALKEDEAAYISQAHKLCKIVRDIQPLFPVPSEESRKNTDGSLKRLEQDIDLSSSELQGFRQYWRGAGLNSETNDPLSAAFMGVGSLPPVQQSTPAPPQSPVATPAPGSTPQATKPAESTPQSPVSPPSQPTPTSVPTTSPQQSIGLAQIIENAKKKTIRILVPAESGPGGFSGTGFYVKCENLDATCVVSNNHVAKSGNRFITDFGELKLVKTDPENDLAIFLPTWTVDPANVWQLGNDPKKGDAVIASGFPGSIGFTSNIGQVNNITSTIKVAMDEQRKNVITFKDVIEYSSQSTGGISGGPLTNDKQTPEVVGICFSSASHEEAPEVWAGRSFAIPVSRLKALLATLRK